MLGDEQPPNTPALVDYFICQLNLHQILSLALKVFVRYLPVCSISPSLN
jgi:hypothetical protein